MPNYTRARTRATTHPAATVGRAPVPWTFGRDQWLRLYPIALGLGGLGGAWRTAMRLGAPVWPAVFLTVLCLGAWLTVTVMYLVTGGADPRKFLIDLRHREQGFALGYISVIPLLLLASPTPRTPAFRILDLALAAV